jgi:hypothetical protein
MNRVLMEEVEVLRQIIAVISCCAFLATQNEAPERRVQENLIISMHDPKVLIRLPESVHYVGANRWVLYGIADCELHAFVKPDEQKNVEEVYWVQFEGYIPTQPDLHHKYDSPRHATIEDMDFYVDTWTRSNGEKTETGSDREHIDALIRAKGYKIPENMMYVRLVHLLDPEKRKELMIIYGEDLTSTGFTVADLREGGKAYGQWPTLQKGLIERAKTKINLKGNRQAPNGT